jgi:NAD(P)-dependent dehydrogenase (short-subunit alcohol dehydrogenase family)
LDFDDIVLTQLLGVTAYRKSKLAMIAWTFDLAGRLAGRVTVSALHPASLMPTKMVLETGWKTMSSVREDKRH